METACPAGHSLSGEIWSQLIIFPSGSSLLNVRIFLFPLFCIVTIAFSRPHNKWIESDNRGHDTDGKCFFSSNKNKTNTIMDFYLLQDGKTELSFMQSPISKTSITAYKPVNPSLSNLKQPCVNLTSSLWSFLLSLLCTADFRWVQ